MTFCASPSLDKYRLFTTHMPSNLATAGIKGNGQNGMLHVKPRGLTIIFSNGLGWEHVSVSRRSRMPTYEDMRWVKRHFWSPEDCVMQLHVPESEHVNMHKYCLHLWRPMDVAIPRPPAELVGLKQ